MATIPNNKHNTSLTTAVIPVTVLMAKKFSYNKYHDADKAQVVNQTMKSKSSVG